MYEAVIKVCLDDPPEKRAREITEGIGYACALLRDEYGLSADDVVWLLEKTIDNVSYDADGS